MTRTDAVRSALESMEKTCQMLRAFLNEPEATEERLTPGEVAARLRVSRSFVSDEIRSGRLPAIRLGPRKWAVPERELRKWESARLNRRSL